MEQFKETSGMVDFNGYLQDVRTLHAMQTCAITALDAGRTESAHTVLIEILSKLSQLEDDFSELADKQNNPD